MYQRMRFESDHRASWQKVNSFPFVLTPIDAEDSPGILSFPSYSPRGIEEEDRVPSRSRIRFLNKRLGVCSAQGTGRGGGADSTGGSRLSNATRVLLYSRRKLREKWGEEEEGWWARPSFASGPSEFEREREGESVANKRTSRRNDDGEKEETIARLFFLDSKGNDTGIRRAIVGSRRSI